ncbi:TonB family protein [Geofilum rubicundum]|uniref:TonB family protein n=1 Tax=Geofilum rubicundum TaxID=472113 RepID=UPI0007820CA6|nr:TonB family protein [Geofilum rubicundum]
MKKQRAILSKAGRLGFFIFGLLIILPFTSKASGTTDSVYTVVDRAPKFKGQPSRLLKFVEQHMVYPDEAWRKGIEGVVNVSYTITKDGQLIDAKVENG